METATPRVNRLVLVEDDPPQARLLAQVLNSALRDRVEIAVHIDSGLALKDLTTNGVDVLVTDLDMPQVTGLDLLRKARDFNPCAQALIMTCASTANTLATALDLGATDYLLKPVVHHELIDLVEQAIARVDRWRRALAGTLELQRLVRHARV